MRLPPAVGVAVAGALALFAGGCAIGNHVVEMQAPAVVSGTVFSGPGCPPSAGTAAEPCLVRAEPGAVVVASGRDGAHQVTADGSGRYRLSVLTGVWSLTASVSGGGPGPAVQLFLDPGRTYHLDLRTS